MIKILGKNLVLFTGLFWLAGFCFAEKSTPHIIFTDFSPKLSNEKLKEEIHQAINAKENLVNELNHEQAEKGDILISIGEQAFSRNINKTGFSFHLAFYISEIDYFRITRKHPEVSNTSAIFSGQSLQRQWVLAKELIPSLTRFSTIDSANENIVEEQHNFSLDEKLSAALNHALRETPLLILQENKLLLNGDNVRRILLSSYRLNKPVIGANKSIVKAGALATTLSNRAQLLDALKNTIQAITNNKQTANCYPAEFDIYVNEQVAKSFGLTPPDNKHLIATIKKAGGSYCE